MKRLHPFAALAGVASTLAARFALAATPPAPAEIPSWCAKAVQKHIADLVDPCLRQITVPQTDRNYPEKKRLCEGPKLKAADFTKSCNRDLSRNINSYVAWPIR